MEYYVFLIIVYFFLGFQELNLPPKRRYKEKYLFLILFPLYALVAFRGEHMGNDTSIYALMYDDLDSYYNVGKAILYSRMELGFVAICYAANHFGLSYFQFQIIASTFIYLSIFFFVRKYSSNYAFSCFLILTAGTMAGTMNTLRMHIAIAILLFSITCILRRKWFYFLVLVATAMLFHKSAVVFAIMYPLCSIKYNKKIIALILISSLAILYMGVTFFAWLTETIGAYEGYIEGDYFNEFNTTAIIIGLIINILLIVFVYSVGFFKVPQFRYSNNKRTYSISMNYFCMMAMLVTLCLSIIGLGNTIMSRISGYFSIILITMLPSCTYQIKSRGNKIFAYIAIAFFYAAYFIAIRVLRPEWNHIAPYEWGF